MNRALEAVALLLLIVLVLPAVAAWAQDAVPALISLLIAIALLRVAWPSRGRR